MFVPDVCNVKRQKFCTKAECHRASKRESQRQWSAKNRDYWRDPNSTQRVREHRARKKAAMERDRREAVGSEVEMKQDILPETQTWGMKQDVLPVGEVMALSSQGVLNLLIGLVSFQTHEMKQENLAPIISGLIERGTHVNMKFAGQTGENHAKTTT